MSSKDSVATSTWAMDDGRWTMRGGYLLIGDRPRWQM
jgi:hypothetical protein